MSSKKRDEALSNAPRVTMSTEALLNQTIGPLEGNTVATMTVEYYMFGQRVYPCVAILDVLFAHIAYEMRGEYGNPAWPALKLRVGPESRALLSVFRKEGKARLMGLTSYATCRSVAAVACAQVCKAIRSILGGPGFVIRFADFEILDVHAIVHLGCHVDITDRALYTRRGVLDNRVTRPRSIDFLPTDGSPSCTMLVCPWGNMPLTNVRSLTDAVLATRYLVKNLHPFCVTASTASRKPDRKQRRRAP
jgi:hypothetical protein